MFERLQFLALFLTGGIKVPNLPALLNLPQLTVSVIIDTFPAPPEDQIVSKIERALQLPSD